ncbi:hypothetical protein GCM10010492_66700 [Saccharothrix mutabilis subsp. mutabilis]|uniref:Uncharacterized protein n=1 Tax=Saccharothrix mutabilis subsp. mutabilis TaxID=66855 RepID=A0ABP3ED28_9PSEU
MASSTALRIAESCRWRLVTLGVLASTVGDGVALGVTDTGADLDNGATAGAVLFLVGVARWWEDRTAMQ